MLQEFLNANLLPITDEVNFGKLKKASEEIAKKLNKNKTKVLSYTLTAMDPDVPADNPNVIEVRELVINKYWSTFQTNAKDTPITFIRAVMFEALEIVSKEISMACLVWLTGRNVLKHFILFGKELEIVKIFLSRLGNEVENKAINSWSLPTDSKIQKLSLEIKEITGVTIDKSTLQKRLVHATGPHDETSNVPYQNPTNIWPNSGEPWVHQFVPKAAQSIADVVNKALKDQAKELTVIQSQILESVNKILLQTQSDILEKNVLMQMRTQLLWWKEASYSSSLDKSYRGQQNGLIQISLANDYSVFIPPIYPKSVDFFLKETHRCLVKGDNNKIKVSDFLKQVELSRKELKSIFTEPIIEYGRVSLLVFIRGLVWSKYTADQFNDLVGFKDTSEVSMSDITVWLFHDFQSLKITTSI